MTALGCDEALASLPASWRSAVAGLDLEGEIEGSARLHFDATAPEAAALGLDIRNRCRAAVDPIAARAREETPRTSLQDLPSHVPEAFVAAEDGRFFRHHGFDKRQIEQSLIANLQAGAIRRGGSTITQQLAKNLFLHHRRTFSRKLQEALIAWRLEHALDKQEILERYLSIVQLSSDGVTGIEDGARHWFGVSARRLSLEQAAFLAAITPEPTTMGARLDRAGGLDPTSQLRIDQVLRAMRRDGYITARELRRADPSALRLRRLEHASR